MKKHFFWLSRSFLNHLVTMAIPSCSPNYFICKNVYKEFYFILGWNNRREKCCFNFCLCYFSHWEALVSPAFTYFISQWSWDIKSTNLDISMQIKYNKARATYCPLQISGREGVESSLELPCSPLLTHACFLKGVITPCCWQCKA